MGKLQVRVTPDGVVCRTCEADLVYEMVVGTEPASENDDLQCVYCGERVRPETIDGASA